MSFIPIVCPPGSSSGGGADVENLLLCDVLNGEIVGTALAVYEFDSDGNPVGPPTFIDPNTGDPYVAQGVLQPCPEGSQSEFVLCDIQPDGSSTQFIRKIIQSATGLVLEVQDQTIDGAVYVPTGTVALCDPYTTCTPTADQDLNAACGPGEAADQVIIQNDASHPLANSVFEDDPAADALCGGQWDNPEPGATFQVDETFRNATFDQPGPVLQGTGPSSAPPTYPLLTADPVNAGEGNPVIPNDAAGAGWLRMSDLDSGTNGVWQVPGPFSTSQGMTASVTFASHDGTTPGGDGLAFVFTDGSVAPQAFPIGGFGNLGLQNWQGGYVAVVLDEYGQTCSCQHSAPPIIDPNPGPCGFCTNTISIQLAGAARVGASCQCCTIAQTPTAPKAVNLTTRSQPGRLYVSIIEEAGQTFVSAGIDWNDGNGVVQYFDRVNVTTCAGAAPATLRMALYGGSGGSFRAVKEYQDAQARPAGESHWRAFPITTDAIPPCTTLVNIEASVDVTFNSDTQTTGNGDPEAYFWLVNEATNTVLDKAVKSSVPSQVGTPTTLTVNASVAPGDVPNLRIYVGSENRDQSGEYDTLWENLVVTATGTGCPAPQRRTLEISARCPIPVTMAGSEGGGGTTVVNTPATFEDAAICMTVGGLSQGGFRREVRSPDGSVTVTFLGADGLPQIPTAWFPGPCVERDSESFVFCDDNGPFIRSYIFDENGNILGTDNFTLSGLPYAPVGPIVDCPQEVIVEGGLDVEQECYIDNAGVQFFRTFVYTDTSGVPTAVGNVDIDGNPYVPVPGPGFPRPCTDGPIEFDHEEEILCDDNGPFIRRYSYQITDAGAGVPIVSDYDLDGNAYLTVGTVGTCPVDVALDSTIDVEYSCYIDNNGDIFYRAFVFTDATGIPTAVGNFDINGALFVPVPGPGFPRPCDDGPLEFDHEENILCDDNGPFIRRYSWLITDAGASPTNVADFTLAGAAYITVGPVTVCDAPLVQLDFEDVVLCDATPTQFIRTYVYDSANPGVVDSFFDTDLTGAPFVPVGATGLCSDCCAQQLGEGCWDDGSNTGNWISYRNPDGSVEVLDTVTGLPVNPADIVPCSVAQQNETHFVALTAATIFNIPTAGLVSWSVRCVNTTVTITVGADPPVALVAGEVVTSSAPEGSTLSDTVTVNVGTGLAHVAYQLQL